MTANLEKSSRDIKDLQLTADRLLRAILLNIDNIVNYVNHKGASIDDRTRMTIRQLMEALKAVRNIEIREMRIFKSIERIDPKARGVEREIGRIIIDDEILETQLPRLIAHLDEATLRKIKEIELDIQRMIALVDQEIRRGV